jgi:hypothetical protein
MRSVASVNRPVDAVIVQLGFKRSRGPSSTRWGSCPAGLDSADRSLSYFAVQIRMMNTLVFIKL